MYSESKRVHINSIQVKKKRNGVGTATSNPLFKMNPNHLGDFSRIDY